MIEIWFEEYAQALHESRHCRLYVSLMTSLPSAAFNSRMCPYVKVGEIKSSYPLYLDLMYDLQSTLVIVQVDVCKFIETTENGMWNILRVRSNSPQTQFCGTFLLFILRVYYTEK